MYLPRYPISLHFRRDHVAFAAPLTLAEQNTTLSFFLFFRRQADYESRDSLTKTRVMHPKLGIPKGSNDPFLAFLFHGRLHT